MRCRETDALFGRSVRKPLQSVRSIFFGTCDDKIDIQTRSQNKGCLTTEQTFTKIGHPLTNVKVCSLTFLCKKYDKYLLLFHLLYGFRSD